MKKGSSEESKVEGFGGDEEFRRKLFEYGFKIVEMKGDGSCFYHALVNGLKRLQLSVEKLRKIVHEEVQSKRDEYRGLFEGQCGRNSEEEMDNILDKSHWADHQDICILAIALKCRIIIFQAEFSNPLVIEHQEVQAEETVYVSRHNQNHYNLLLPRTDEDEGEVELDGTNLLTQINTFFNGGDASKIRNQMEEESILDSISNSIDEVMGECQSEDNQSKYDIVEEGKGGTYSEMHTDKWINLYERKKGKAVYFALRSVLQNVPPSLTNKYIQRNVELSLLLNKRKYELLLESTSYAELTEAEKRIASIYLDLIVFSDITSIEIHVHSDGRKKDVIAAGKRCNGVVNLRRNEDWSFNILTGKNDDCNSMFSGKGWYRSCLKGCNYSDADFEKVKAHIKDTHGINVYKCLDCKGKVIRNIVEHEYITHGGKRVCKLCNKQFNNQNAYSKHDNVHKFEMGLSENVSPIDVNVSNADLLETMKSFYKGCQLKIVRKKGFLIMYDERLGRIVFAFTSLTQTQLLKKIEVKKRMNFKNEPGLIEYTEKSIGFLNFHCGHLIPAGDMMFDVEAFEDSYSLVNVSPMTSYLNSGVWANIESIVRKVGKLCNRVHYFSIPVYGKNSAPRRSCGGFKIHVPEYFAKIIFYEKPGENMFSQAFICRNAERRIEEVISPTNVVATNDELKKLTGLEFIEVEQTWSKNRKSWICTNTMCKKSFVSREQMMEHLSSHKSFVCDQCNVKYNSMKMLTLHKKKHRLPNFFRHTCKFKGCGEGFRSALKYKLHLKSHTHKKKYVCVYKNCGKVYYVESSLYDHMLKHRKPKFACRVCDFLCWKQLVLVHHYCRHHPNEPLEEDTELVKEKYRGITNTVKVFQCEECDYRTPYKSTFNTHYEAAHCNNEYICEGLGCNKRFRTRDGLQRHRTIYCPSTVGKL